MLPIPPFRGTISTTIERCYCFLWGGFPHSDPTGGGFVSVMLGRKIPLKISSGNTSTRSRVRLNQPAMLVYHEGYNF